MVPWWSAPYWWLKWLHANEERYHVEREVLELSRRVSDLETENLILKLRNERQAALLRDMKRE